MVPCPIGRNVLLEALCSGSFDILHGRWVLGTIMERHPARAIVKLRNNQWRSNQPSRKLLYHRREAVLKVCSQQVLGSEYGVEKLLELYRNCIFRTAIRPD